jgi:hypothetical protein
MSSRDYIAASVDFSNHGGRSIVGPTQCPSNLHLECCAKSSRKLSGARFQKLAGGPNTPPTDRQQYSGGSSYSTTCSNVDSGNGIAACQGSRGVIQAAEKRYEACRHRRQFPATCFSREAKRITEIDRISAREPIQIQPTRDADGVHLGGPTGLAAPYWRRPRNVLGAICLDARHRSVGIVHRQNFPDAHSGVKWDAS